MICCVMLSFGSRWSIDIFHDYPNDFRIIIWMRRCQWTNPKTYGLINSMHYLELIIYAHQNKAKHNSVYISWDRVMVGKAVICHNYKSMVAAKITTKSICSYNSSFRITAKRTSKFQITYSWWGESTGDQSIFLTKGWWCRKHFHVMTSTCQWWLVTSSRHRAQLKTEFCHEKAIEQSENKGIHTLVQYFLIFL